MFKYSKTGVREQTKICYKNLSSIKKQLDKEVVVTKEKSQLHYINNKQLFLIFKHSARTIENNGGHKELKKFPWRYDCTNHVPQLQSRILFSVDDPDSCI